MLGRADALSVRERRRGALHGEPGSLSLAGSLGDDEALRLDGIKDELLVDSPAAPLAQGTLGLQLLP